MSRNAIAATSEPRRARIRGKIPVIAIKVDATTAPTFPPNALCRDFP
jgi:hypothetical protein